MSWSITTYVGVGVMIDPFDPYENEEKWLPYVEGHQDVELSLSYGEGSEKYFFGQVLAEQGNDDYYEDDHKDIHQIEIPDTKVIAEKIRSTGYDVKDEDVKVWFFTTWM